MSEMNCLYTSGKLASTLFQPTVDSIFCKRDIIGCDDDIIGWDDDIIVWDEEMSIWDVCDAENGESIGDNNGFTGLS